METTLLSKSRRPEGTSYLVKVPDVKNPLGYDLVTVLVHDNGARSIVSTARSTRTPHYAGLFVTKLIAGGSR